MTRRETLLKVVGVQAALITAAAHLLWLYPQLSWSLLTGAVTDVRPYLFLLASTVLVSGSVAVFNGAHYRRLYALLIGTLGSLCVGFILWEGTNTPAALAGEPLATVAKGAELIGILAFSGLYWLHHPDRYGPDVASKPDPDR